MEKATHGWNYYNESFSPGYTMTTQMFREKLLAQPFRPFDVLMADGRRYHVASPEFVAVSPGGRTAVVFTGEESSATLDLLLMTALEEHRNGRRPRRPRA